jgi:DNA-binding MarR family transcriptional regulator
MSTANFNKQLFDTILNNGSDSIAQYARKLNQPYKKVYQAVIRMEQRGLVVTRESQAGEHDFVQVEAIVGKEQATFRGVPKIVAPKNIREAIFNFIYDVVNADSRQVQEAFQNLSARQIYRTLNVLKNQMGYLLQNEDGVYRVAVSKVDAVFNNVGRPVGTFKTTVKLGDLAVKIDSKTARSLLSQLKKQVK